MQGRAVSKSVGALSVLVIVLAATTAYGFLRPVSTSTATATSTSTMTSISTSTAAQASTPTCTTTFPLTTQAYLTPDPAHLPFYLADKLGFLKQECLSFSKDVLLFGDAGVVALLKGDINIQSSADPSVVAFMRGGPIKLVYAYHTGIDYGNLVARPGITNISQVKTIASERPGTGTYAWITTLLQYYHVNATQVPFDTSSLRMAALVAEKVDAAPMTIRDYFTLLFKYGPQYHLLVTNGGPVSPYSIDIPPSATIGEGIIVSNSFYSSHPDVVRGIIRASLRATGVILTQPNVTIPIIMQVFNYTRPQAELFYKYVAPTYFQPYYVNQLGDLVIYNSVQGVNTWYQGAAKFNKISNPPDPSTFVDFSIYNDIMQKGLQAP